MVGGLQDAKKIPLSQREPTFYSAVSICFYHLKLFSLLNNLKIRKRRRPERKFEAKKVKFTSIKISCRHSCTFYCCN